MSADNYMLVREKQGSFVVTMESMSADEPLETFEEAKERILNGVVSQRNFYTKRETPFGAFYEGVFDSEEQAEAFVDKLYDDDEIFIEYGADFRKEE